MGRMGERGGSGEGSEPEDVQEPTQLGGIPIKYVR